MLETFLIVVHIIVALFLILVVLVQGGHSGGIGAVFGGGNSTGLFGAGGASSLLSKLTFGAAVIFVITTLSLSLIQGKPSSSELKEKLERKSQEQATAGQVQNKVEDTKSTAQDQKDLPKKDENKK